MSSILTRFTFTLFFTFLLVIGFGQSSTKAVVSGNLLEKSSGAPLLYATVIFYQAADSTMAANALTERLFSFRSTWLRAMLMVWS